MTAIGSAPDAGTPGTPEHELLANWNLPDSDWESEYARRIEAFMASVSARCATATGFTPVFQLAESRRREFRKRKLAEFRLTTPRTNIAEDAPLLEFAPDGTVRESEAAPPPRERSEGGLYRRASASRPTALGEGAAAPTTRAKRGGPR